MKRLVTGCLMFGACLGVGQAVAADLPQPEVSAPVYDPVPQERFYWTGFYFGGNIGATYADRAANGPVTGAFKSQRTGVSGGFQAGYNHMMSPNFLIGLEADLGFADIAKRSTAGGVALRTSSDWNSSLRARAGWAFDRYLVYGTAGLAVADVDWTSAGGSDSTTAIGYTVGAGVEGAVSDRVTARVEYLYTDYGSENFNLGGTALKSDLDTHTARVGLNYKF
ncbi:outer membrane protein [Breoghania sp. L-A4]|uniref:outer membrane protein n=1 Tax=Breoghania sp. L-A4 TaxID=2304600 RepID=UPI000E35DAD3|nr:outer membrane protein [Breoghania sp. L-A4]AXS41429.1 porin family protein [Breoghania sp. L-A4]